jgi:methane/phenol/toluene hydroxylase
MRHAQAIVIYLMDLEDQIEGFRDVGAKERWLSDPIYQPMRRLTEELMAIEDWAELPVAVHLAVDPILSEVGASVIVRRHGAFHGDTVSPQVVATTERDRRRNLEWTQELVRMVTDGKIPAADENRELVKAWIARWTPRALAATEALAPIFERIPNRRGSFDEAVARARDAQAAIIASLEPKSAEAA